MDFACNNMTKLIDKFGQDKQWTNWKYEEVKGKLTKVPYFTKTRKASSTDPSTWKTYEQAENDFNNGGNKFSGFGVFFKLDQTFLGIDVDHCLVDGKIVHEQKDKIERLLSVSNTYAELSPSKTGFHLFFIITESFPILDGDHKKAPYEIYSDKRYFTVTNIPFGEEKDIRTVTPEQMKSILSIIDHPWSSQKINTLPSTHNFSDDEVLNKMLSSKKNGSKIKSLYNGDTSAYKDDKSSADMALCSHLAFWTGKNASQMERIWLASPLGQREKTKDRSDYRKRTINAAISKCTEIYESPLMKIRKDNPKLELLSIFNKEGEQTIVQNTENICRVLRDHPNFENRLRYDNFKNIIEIKPTKTNVWRSLEDNDAVNIQTAISIILPCFSKVGKEMVYDAIIKVSKENAIDSAIDYLTSLKWDKTLRLDRWLSETYGCPNDAYHQAVGSNWIKGMVKRLVEPGCKFDYVLVLEGEQGVKKSTSLYVLGGEWHTETAMSTDSKDFFMQFSGKSIIEFSEGETLSRTEVKRMKAIITMQYDRFRVPYERATKDFPRRCVFAMTTNQTEYLKDETGNRRWLPVSVVLPEANIEWLKENRDQLLAEAYEKVVKRKETVYEFPKEETIAAQDARRIRDPNADLIADWYYNTLSVANRNEGITIFQVYRDALCKGYPTKIMSKWEEMSIADVLKTHLKLIKKNSMRDSVRAIRWFNQKNESLVEEDLLDSAIMALNS